MASWASQPENKLNTLRNGRPQLVARFLWYTISMAIPNIDTFEHDIREEIKNREASVGDIASASGNVGNVSSNTSRTSNSSKALLIFAGIMLLFIVSGFGYLGYVYIVQKPATKEKAAQILDQQSKDANTEKIISEKLNKISPIISSGVSHFTSKIDTTPLGSVLTLNNYASVFAFMIKNEPAIAGEVMASEIKKYENSTTTPDLSFVDQTKSNQNMRVLNVGSSTFVYAFFGEGYLAISNSVENILQMRGAIIK